MPKWQKSNETFLVIFKQRWDFSLLLLFSGNLRRFRRICEHTQSVVSVVRRQPLPPASPRAARRNSTNKEQSLQPRPPSRSSQIPTPIGGGTHSKTTTEVSDSSSCNSDVSHGLEPNKNGPRETIITGGGNSDVGNSGSDHVAVTTNKATTIATPKVMEGSS